MNVVIVGGTGFIGRNIAPVLAGGGHAVTILTRNQRTAAVVGRRCSRSRMGSVESADPGTSLSRAGRGHQPYGRLRCRTPVDAIAQGRASCQPNRDHADDRDGVVPSLHARSTENPHQRVGCRFLWTRDGSNHVDEMHGPGTGFLADLCVEWEREAFRATDYGIRTTCLRISMVLGQDGGALQKMLLPFKLFLGGPIGKGTQPVSWIHVEDLGRLVAAILEHPSYSGAINAASPHPVTMKEFCLQLGRALGRPSWLPVPALALQIGLGEMATLMTHGQSVNPLYGARAGIYLQLSGLGIGFVRDPGKGFVGGEKAGRHAGRPLQ